MSNEFLGDRRQALEDAFFKKEEERQIQEMREQMREQHSHAELVAASGVRDEAVLEHLVELGLTATTVAALTLVPLVRVAWADGKVQDAERDAILAAAAAKGITENTPAYELLGSWLASDKKLAPLYDAWGEYVGALKNEMTEAQLARLQTHIVTFARLIAEAAGGFLGMHTVSKSEEEALIAIEAAFSS